MPVDLAKALSETDLFAGIHPDGLRRLAAICEEQSFDVADVIFKEGDIGDSLYLIEEGRVRISRMVSGMGEEALAVLGPGSTFGEMALIDETPRSADARVQEPCRVIRLEKAALEDLLFLDKDLAYEILFRFVRILSSRLRETNDKMTFLSVTGRF